MILKALYCSKNLFYTKKVCFMEPKPFKKKKSEITYC